jgi:hypothetical protein
MMESGRNPSSVGLVRRTPSPVLGNFGDDHTGFWKRCILAFTKLVHGLYLCPYASVPKSVDATE